MYAGYYLAVINHDMLWASETMHLYHTRVTAMLTLLGVFIRLYAKLDR